MTKKHKTKKRLALRYAGDDKSRSGDETSLSGDASLDSSVSPVPISGTSPSSQSTPCFGSRGKAQNQISNNPSLSAANGPAPLSGLVDEINTLSCFAPISGINTSFAQALIRAPSDVVRSPSANGASLLGLHSLELFPSLSNKPASGCSVKATSASVLLRNDSIVSNDFNVLGIEDINIAQVLASVGMGVAKDKHVNLLDTALLSSVSTKTTTPIAWTSLFHKLPPNAGNYIPKDFVIKEEDGIFIPPQEVIDAGHEFWKDYVVGFFLDENPSYDVVRAHCRRAWRLKGGLRVHYDNSMFYFHFNIPEERQRILESPPTIIQGKPFIITPWSPSVDAAREQVLSIPVWAHFSHIPSVFQPMEGLDWLASLIGDLICFDVNTVARKRLVYAKALIEIKPDKPLPNKLKVRPAIGQVAFVDVHYSWQPDICITCHSFGHTTDFCKHGTTPIPLDDAPLPIPPKIPLPRPITKHWIPKISQPAIIHDELHNRHETCNTPNVTSPELGKTNPLEVNPPSSDTIIWNATEQAWEHVSTEMRYKPDDGSYYKFVSEVLGEDRFIFYHAMGDSLVMTFDGIHGDWNRKLLLDSSWDRKFLYSCDSADFFPGLALLFSGFLHVMGPLSSDDCSVFSPVAGS